MATDTNLTDITAMTDADLDALLGMDDKSAANVTDVTDMTDAELDAFLAGRPDGYAALADNARAVVDAVLAGRDMDLEDSAYTAHDVAVIAAAMEARNGWRPPTHWLDGITRRAPGFDREAAHWCDRVLARDESDFGWWT